MIYDLSEQIDYKRAVARMKKLLDDQSKIEIKLIRKKRTIKQNAYLHVCISLYSVYFGYRLSEGKVVLKRLCPFMTYDKNGMRFLKESSKLDTKEMTDFIEWIRNHSSQEGCYIPSAEEYLENKYKIDKEIESHKPYL